MSSQIKAQHQAPARFWQREWVQNLTAENKLTPKQQVDAANPEEELSFHLPLK